MTCCGSPDEKFFEMDDDGLNYVEGIAITGEEGSASSLSSSSISEGSDDILQTSYVRKPPLFRAIEHQQWENVLGFLQTGRWSLSLFQHSLEHMKAASPVVQCRTWVKKGNLNQLPLHLAIVKGAPSIVVQHMVETYPNAVRCCDSEDRLPIHLAFSSAATDAVIACLLKVWPQSCAVSPKPHECGDGLRSEIIKIAVQETEAAVQKKFQEDWRQLVAESGVELQDTSDLKTVLAQLVADRRQLQDMKAKLKGQFSRKAQESAIITPEPPKKPRWRFGK